LRQGSRLAGQSRHDCRKITRRAQDAGASSQALGGHGGFHGGDRLPQLGKELLGVAELADKPDRRGDPAKLIGSRSSADTWAAAGWVRRGGGWWRLVLPA
jgi:hypothetical protein